MGQLICFCNWIVVPMPTYLERESHACRSSQRSLLVGNEDATVGVKVQSILAKVSGQTVVTDLNLVDAGSWDTVLL